MSSALAVQKQDKISPRALTNAKIQHQEKNHCDMLATLSIFYTSSFTHQLHTRHSQKDIAWLTMPTGGLLTEKLQSTHY